MHPVSECLLIIDRTHSRYRSSPSWVCVCRVIVTYDNLSLCVCIQILTWWVLMEQGNEWAASLSLSLPLLLLSPLPTINARCDSSWHRLAERPALLSKQMAMCFVRQTLGTDTQTDRQTDMLAQVMLACMNGKHTKGCARIWREWQMLSDI